MRDRAIRIGTRGSALARVQTDEVVAILRAAWPEIDIEVIPILPDGDRRKSAPLQSLGRGAFVKGLEEPLLRGEIDLAVPLGQGHALDAPRRACDHRVSQPTGPQGRDRKQVERAIRRPSAGSKARHQQSPARGTAHCGQTGHRNTPDTRERGYAIGQGWRGWIRRRGSGGRRTGTAR